MRQRAAWKHKLANAHPDRGGSADRFRRLDQARRKWQFNEAAWYARHGLLPPDGFSAHPHLDSIRARNRRALVSLNPAFAQLEEEV